MQKPVRIILLAAALIALGVWGWRVLFPSPEKIIRSRLTQLAATASFKGDEGMIAKAYRAEKLAGFFTANAVLHVDVSGYEAHTIEGRAEVQQMALAARQHLQGLKVEFRDINVTLGPNKQSARVDLTGKATVPGRNDLFVQEFDVQLKKVDGTWLIDRVETVKTL